MARLTTTTPATAIMTHLAAFADLHLGAHYTPGSPWVREELSGRAANQDTPDVVVFAGDLFDRHTSGPEQEAEGAQLFRWITQEMQLPVVAIWGNHDVAKGFEFHSRFPTIDGVYFPHGYDVCEITVPGINITFHAVNVAKKRDKRELIDDFPVVDVADSQKHVGVFHTGLTGEYTKNNCLPATLEQLQVKNYGAWVLGHVHAPTTLSQHPFIGWPGTGVMVDIRL
ncbi:metallophosphoesterase family protein [Corynebacterium cystitidis]|uniref:metallophosphoesterase family protein n=1 Tax=Corynebacterium cystitidis TaxID=35757 RepID=UPI00211F4365|nr:metallophosphoesterase [Corynebacterium cystitidis]